MYTRLEQLCKLMVDSGNQFITVLYIHIYFFVLPAENHLVSENKEVLGKTQKDKGMKKVHSNLKELPKAKTKTIWGAKNKELKINSIELQFKV